MRTKSTTVTFQLPFLVDGYDRELPAGDYQLATDEELVEGLSFPAYRRVATHLYIHPKPGITEMLPVSWAEITAAQLRDEVAAKTEGSRKIGAPLSDENATPSQSTNSNLAMNDGLDKAQKDKKMYISPPIVVSAIVVLGLGITAWLNPADPVKTERTVSLSASTYEQLQSWSKQQTGESGQALSVNQLIERLASNWQNANPSPVKSEPTTN